MKIYVLSRKELRKMGYIDKTFFANENRYFISIAGIADGCEYPHPFLTKDSKRVLHLLFDDVTETEKDNPSIRLFDETHANKIFEFIKTIPNDVELYVNCAAGISRSGAVGFVLNEYFNQNNIEDYSDFKKNNFQIQPNPMVKRVLTEIIFGKVDYSKVFS
jgi:predicted protein tyrosine phosphatase